MTTGHDFDSPVSSISGAPAGSFGRQYDDGYGQSAQYGSDRFEPVQVGPAASRSALRALVALCVVFAILGLAGGGYLLARVEQVEREADAANDRATALDERVSELEQRVADNLDSTAVAAAATPSVFKIVAGKYTGTAFAFGRAPQGGGTDLVTNYHVVESSYTAEATDTTIERDNRRFPVTISKVDKDKDLAIVHCDQELKRLVAAKAAVVPGQPVLVIGAPLGMESTVTTGVVSALRDNEDGRMVQFDAAINPGNSGGPVLDSRQGVVGVASAKIKNAAEIGLAIPVSVVCDSMGIC